jgi:hypothetical protein
MIKRAIRLSLLLSGVVFTAACGTEADTDAARVTIDMRCGDSAACPTGFQCEAETEHGPPTTLCQSTDAEAECPAGFETQIGYSQIFCKPHGSSSASVRSSRTSSVIVRDRKVGKWGVGGERGGTGI